MTMSNVKLNECDLPDEYIDAVVSFDAETIEEPPSVGSTILRSLVPHHWLQSDNTVKTTEDHSHVNDMKLSEVDLPDEYVDAVAVISFDDSDTAEILLDPLAAAIDSFNCLHHSIESTAEDRNEIFLNEYDLPDDYITAEVSCSPRDKPNEEASQLFRLRREYPPNPTNKTLPMPLRTPNLTYDLSNLKNYTDKDRWPKNIKDRSMDELVPAVKSSKANSLLRKRSRQHQSVTEF